MVRPARRWSAALNAVFVAALFVHAAGIFGDSPAGATRPVRPSTAHLYKVSNDAVEVCSGFTTIACEVRRGHDDGDVVPRDAAPAAANRDDSFRGFCGFRNLVRDGDGFVAVCRLDPRFHNLIHSGRDVHPALVIGRHYVTERDSAPVQYNGIL